MTEEKKEAKKEEAKANSILVVEKLPVQEYNQVTDAKGNAFDLVTRDDAIAEILTLAREIRKAL